MSASTAAPQPETPSRWTWRRRLGVGLGAVLAFLLLTWLGIRWAGTFTYEGEVLRVYEKLDDYRVEVAMSDGEVAVLVNRETRFPYFKTNTADLQARLEKLEQDDSLVRVHAFGFRNSWISMFPNVVGVDLVLTAEEVNQQRAERFADRVVATLAEGAPYADALATDAARAELRQRLIDALADELARPIATRGK